MPQLRPDVGEATVVVSPAYRGDLGAASGESNSPSRGRQPSTRLRRDDARFGLDSEITAALASYSTPRRVSDGRSEPLDDNEQRGLARLVLDGVLEIESGGGFVSGLDAIPRLFEGQPASLRDSLAEPSRGALEYAHALMPIDASRLASRLYVYGSLPVSPRSLSRLADETAIATYMGLDDVKRHPSFARNAWACVDTAGPSEWIAFRRRGIAVPPSSSRRLHKLYVGVVPSELTRVLGALADDLLSSEAVAFKVAGTPRGLRRSDKCVAYFPSREALERTSERIARCISGALPHRVPFAETCPASDCVWWSSDRSLGDDDSTQASGRYEVCALLALSLVIASRAREPSISAIDFALLRLTLDGWDVTTFSNAAWKTS